MLMRVTPLDWQKVTTQEKGPVPQKVLKGVCHVVVFQAPDWTVCFREWPLSFLLGTIPSPLSLHEECEHEVFLLNL